MSDEDLVNFLIAQTGSPALAVRALGGISTKRLFNWRTRGIAFRYRPRFRAVANRYGANLPSAWLDASVPSLIDEPKPTSGRKSNGRAGKKQHVKKAQGSKGKRQGTQQRARPARRRAAGRGEAAVAG